MKHWEKRNTSREKRIHLAHGRGGSLYTWERESIIFRKREIRFVKLGHRNWGESLLHVFQEKNVLYGLYRGRTVRYNRTAEVKSEIRTVGTFPKVCTCCFVAKQCTEIEGQFGTVFKIICWRRKVVQQGRTTALIAGIFLLTVALLSVYFSDCSSMIISHVKWLFLSLIDFSWVLPHRGEGLALNFSVFLWVLLSSARFWCMHMYLCSSYR